MEYFFIGLESDLGAGGFGFADGGEFADRFSALEAHVINLAVAFNFDFEPFGESVDAADADAVETAGNFVRFFVEFAAGMQNGENDFNRRLFLALVNVYRNTAAIVRDGNTVIAMDHHIDVVGKTTERFVDRIV